LGISEEEDKKEVLSDNLRPDIHKKKEAEEIVVTISKALQKCRRKK